MKKFRYRGLLALVAVLALVGAACAEETSPTTTGTDTATTGTTTTPPEEPDLLARIQEEGVIRVATDQKYKPQSWYDAKTGEWMGFDVDVAREIALRLGVEAEVQHQDWDIVTAGSWNDRWDMNVGSMTDTIEREGIFHFTPAYYFTPAGVAVSGDNTTFAAIGDLSGKKICVGEKTTYEDYLKGTLVLGEAAPPFEVQITDPQTVSYTTDTDALDELDLGDGVRCDAAISAVPTIESYIADGGNMKLLGEPIFYEPLSVAFDKSAPIDNASLVEAVSQIIEDMHADGTLTELSLKWYKLDITSTIGA